VAYATSRLGPVTAPDTETILPGSSPLIIQGPLCAGSAGCVTGESFFPGVNFKIKDAAPLIKLEDAPAPTKTQWGLAGNIGRTPPIDTFSVFDMTAVTLPFGIEKGSPSNSLYIGPQAVGFGTGTPIGNGTSIHIFGPVTADVFSGIGPNPNAGPAFNFGYSGSSFGRSSGFFNVRPDASAALPNPSLRFAVNNTQAMIVAGNGNVGIGQFGAVVGVSAGGTPTQKLHVQGNILAEGNFFSNGVQLNVPDYVFEPDYKLLPLKQLAMYIEKEKHLPSVPSARDIKANGINLSEMQMTLLQKVEELTLYTIQQEDTIQNQGKTITTQTETIVVLRQANKAQQDALAALAARVEALERAQAGAKR